MTIMPPILQTDMMTEEAAADLMLGLIQETEVQPLKTPQHRQTHQQEQKP